MAHSHGPGPENFKAPRRVRVILALAVLPFVLATAAGVALLWPGGEARQIGIELGEPPEFVRAGVITTRSAPCRGAVGPVPLPCTAVEARLLTGSDAGRVVEVEIVDEPNAPDVREGDRVVLGHSPDAPELFRYYYSDHDRRLSLVVLALIFAGVVVALGRWRGLAALGGFVFSLSVLIFFVMPGILAGRNPLAMAIVGGSAVMLGALYLAHGVNVRTTSAALGTFASLALTGLLALLFVEVSRLTGLSSEEALHLNLRATQINLQGLLLAGIIIGTLGVLDDVTITQASAVWQLRIANPSYGARELYSSALKIGRDHIASIVNTLLLAYAGAALPLLILFTLARTSFADVLNGEVIAEEVVRTLVGSIGLVAAVPITTALAALVASSGRPVPAPALEKPVDESKEDSF